MTELLKLNNAIGLAMKAGKCRSGDFAAEHAVRSGEAKLLLLDNAASENTVNRYASMCQKAGIDAIRHDGIGYMIGKSGRIVIAVTDENFAKMIRDAYASYRNTIETTLGV